MLLLFSNLPTVLRLETEVQPFDVDGPYHQGVDD